MTNGNIGQHISGQFNKELEDIRHKVLMMGGLVEQQIDHAIQAFITGDMESAEQVIKQDRDINAMEVAMDQECTQILALRQPAASDLRFLLAVIKIIHELERMGDKAKEIAETTIRLAADQSSFPHYELEHMAGLVKTMLVDVLNSFARMTLDDVPVITQRDEKVDREYESILRQLITHMMEDTRNITKMLDVLYGKTCRLLCLHRPLEAFVGAFDFEEPVVSLEPLIFTIKRLLQTISSRLTARHLAADRLDLRLVLEGGGELSRRLRFPEPQTGVGGMLPLVQTVLESQQLEAAVVRVEVAAGTTFAAAAQREWFGRELPQPERWAVTLARLEALLGPGRVGIPVPPESFRPDAFRLRPATGTGAMGGAGEGNLAYQPEGAVPLRRYRPPREVAVASEWRDQRPWPLALLTGPHVGRIVAWRGPFPVSGIWWDPGGAWQRLEWDVQLEDRNLLRLVYQPPERWQLDGNYG